MRTLLIALLATASLSFAPKLEASGTDTPTQLHSGTNVNEALADQDILEMIDRVAMEHGIDPKLARAIATVESKLNYRAVGTHGEIGLFQLHPKYHNVTVGSVERNVATAMQYLVQLRIQCSGYGEAWFVCYNYGPRRRLKHPELFPYYRRVIAAMESGS